ncbi:MAG TPA: LUD domain-containing protein [Terriglobales bacterium]|nr:LUD domain-containing protein [Terriglobales bacterium]
MAVDNSSREAILGRIKTALRSSAPPPEPARNTPVFPPVENVLDRFRQECATNLVECVVTASQMESSQALANTLASLPDGEVWLQDASELRAIMNGMSAAPRLDTPARMGATRWSSEGRPHEDAQATITLAELLVAATGSMFVSSSCGGRAGSVAAPVHIVYAKVSQLVPDLEAAFARLYAEGAVTQNSFVGLITGSSRTADIEKILVLGAHGPRRVILVLQTGK